MLGLKEMSVNLMENVRTLPVFPTENKF